MLAINSLIFNFIFNTVSKKLKVGTCSKSGRNFSGRICIFHRGGGNKKNYLLIDFKRRLNQLGTVYNILYDSNRTSFVGLIFYDNGYFSNIILSSSVSISNKIFSGDKPQTSLNKGDAILLSYISLFTTINNVELKPFFGSSLARSAGVGAIIISRVNDKVWLKLNSGWNICVSANCIATLGYVSNIAHKMKNIGKAGRNRWLGKRPVVRGVVMNPCDHPHGGGEGKKSPLAAPKSPWGKLTKGSPTKKKKAFRLKKRLFKKIR